MKTNALWVFRNFGFKTTLRFVWDSLKLSLKRLVSGEKPKKFSELTDDEAEEVTLRMTVPQRAVHNYDRTLN